MQYEQRNERFGRVIDQAQFTRPKYLPADLAGINAEPQLVSRTKWYHSLAFQSVCATGAIFTIAFMALAFFGGL